MFSFGHKKPSPKPASGAKRNLAQLGFLDMGVGDQLGSGQCDDSDDDDDLEAELAALSVGIPKKPKKGRKQVVSERELNEMVAHSLKDIPSDAEISDIDDAEVEGELNDLLESSGESSPEPEEPKPKVMQTTTDQLKLVQERLSMYELAEKNAKLSGDNMKARRFGRGVKTLQSMLKDVKSGKSIVLDDVPPMLAPSTKTVEIKPAISSEPSSGGTNDPASANTNIEALPSNVSPSVATKPPVPLRNSSTTPVTPPQVPPVPSRKPSSTTPVTPPHAAPAIPSQASNMQSDSNLVMAKMRRNEYKQNALEARRSGDQAKALQLVRLVKLCDQLIETAEKGGTPDWSQLPPSLQITEESVVAPVSSHVEPVIEEAKPEAVEPTGASVPATPAIPQPRTTLEALEQRLAKYQSIMDQAQAEGNSSKVRRMGRITKQYQAAIKASKAGKPVAFDELPDPPGYPPIPGAPGKPEPADNEGSAVETGAASSAAPAAGPATGLATGPAPPAKTSPVVAPAKSALATRQDKQLAMLMERQNLFRQAALEAKRSGQMDLAKEYLRSFKQMDPLISANKCGVPVDMNTLPIPPQMKSAVPLRKAEPNKSTADEGFEVISSEECTLAPVVGKDSGLLVQLETDLLTQLKVCTTNKEHYKQMGDIANANRFDQLALFTRKDLDVVRSIAMRGDTIPRWKNEIRKFSIVKCCTDLKDDDMEIKIIRGLSYNVRDAKTIDTYVRLEVPIPSSDEAFKEKTTTIHNTNNPEYNQTFQMHFNRKSRSILRIFNGKSIKLEVWSKGGFLRSDTLVGTATVKLSGLLNHCIVHTAVDLMDGRKPIGGKLEVKIRLRDPIIGKEVEQVQEKWTVLI